MTTANVAKEPNWKECAIALNRKLNLIGARLKLIEKQSLIYDVCQTARELVEEFHLDTDQKFVHPAFDELVKLDNEVSLLLCRYNFVPFASRAPLFEQLQKKHSEFSFQLGLYGAFV